MRRAPPSVKGKKKERITKEREYKKINTSRQKFRKWKKNIIANPKDIFSETLMKKKKKFIVQSHILKHTGSDRSKDVPKLKQKEVKTKKIVCFNYQGRGQKKNYQNYGKDNRSYQDIWQCNHI
ncbi:Uncharacterized protein DAT39_022205, partial [Clarias magur]